MRGHHLCDPPSPSVAPSLNITLGLSRAGKGLGLGRLASAVAGSLGSAVVSGLTSIARSFFFGGGGGGGIDDSSAENARAEEMATREAAAQEGFEPVTDTLEVIITAAADGGAA